MTALLRLYPAAYRREFGDEIADAYREATDGAGRAARTREALDVVGHALRMRLGLGSAARAGRFLAALAPFAAVAVGVNAVSWATVTVSSFRFAYRIFGASPLALSGAACLVTLVGAVLALTGRWALGTWALFAGTAAIFASQTFRLGLGLQFAVLFTGPLLLLALVALLCPPDLRPALRVRTAAGVSVVSAGVAVLTFGPAVWPLPEPLSGLHIAVPVAGGLLLAGRQAFARLRTAPAVFLAGFPFVALAASTGALQALFLPLVLGPLLAASAAVAIQRRRAGSTPSA
ncbi:hypothetical protein [Streptomyces sp. NRRL S-244]|uniref:hypothetical protein n=1 Tax=Streptomyces sp. NRRL S-244 TaxID=1463897 RepID=UPI0004C1470A|nr:hypothetical protein [Streptomyces sp. NRRL S-244]